MAAITRSVLERYYSKGGNLKILDAGCGTGAGMDLLSDYGNATGFDISTHAIGFSRTRGHKELAIASVTAIPFADKSFDLVISTDILYFKNIQDDQALHELSRVLIPGGRVILRVPAFDWLRGIHDVKVSTRHRYTLKELKNKMMDNGLHTVFASYANTILFPLVVFKRVCEKLLPPQDDSDIAINTGILDDLFKYCLKFEAHLIKKYTLPFGVSIIAVGNKTLGD